MWQCCKWYKRRVPLLLHHNAKNSILKDWHICTNFHISNKREIFYFILTPLLTRQYVPHLHLCCRIGEQKCFEQSLFRCVGVLQKVFYQVSPHHWYNALPSRITNLWMKLLDFMWMTISSHTCMLYIMYKWVIVNYLSIEYLV